MKNIFYITTFLCFAVTNVFAQDLDSEQVVIDGEILTIYVTEDNDTLYLAELDDVSISSPRSFENRDEYRKYLKYRRYANKVYPYAVEAIKIFRETEEVTQTMRPAKRKRHIKRLQKEMKKEFEEPLKKLTKTQGKILVKMIEKELDTPFHDLVKNLRGGFTATYWSGMGRMFGYKLKTGYVVGEDPILDAVLHDFDISHKQ